MKGRRVETLYRLVAGAPAIMTLRCTSSRKELVRKLVFMPTLVKTGGPGDAGGTPWHEDITLGLFSAADKTPNLAGTERWRSGWPHHRRSKLALDPRGDVAAPICWLDRSNSPPSSPRVAKRRRHSRGESKTSPAQSPHAAIFVDPDVRLRSGLSHTEESEWQKAAGVVDGARPVDIPDGAERQILRFSDVKVTSQSSEDAHVRWFTCDVDEWIRVPMNGGLSGYTTVGGDRPIPAIRSKMTV